MEMEMETTHKRSREELTPSPRGKVEATQAQTKESREGKRQKDEESKVEQTQQQQQQKKQPVRQRTDFVGSVGSQGGSRYSSQDLGITVYMPPHDQYRRIFSKPLNRSNKEQIISLLQGQGKFSWWKAGIKGEYILEGFKKNKINLSEVEFKLLEVEKTKDSGKEKSTRRTSSTSYNI